MSYFTFFPLTPTQNAWEQRRFTQQLKLREIPSAIKILHPPFQGGYVVLPGAPDLRLFPLGQYLVYPSADIYQVKFSGARELETILAKLQWDEKALIKISLHSYGFFGRA